MPELLRIFRPELATYSIQLHPGWLQKEQYDSLRRISMLTGLDPRDSVHEFIKIISQRVATDSIDRKSWTMLKNGLRSSYGNRKIGTNELFDTVFSPKSPKGILARYELLAKNGESYEYAAAIITSKETLLLVAEIPTDGFAKTLSYFREITEGIAETQP